MILSPVVLPGALPIQRARARHKSASSASRSYDGWDFTKFICTRVHHLFTTSETFLTGRSNARGSCHYACLTQHPRVCCAANRWLGFGMGFPALAPSRTGLRQPGMAGAVHTSHPGFQPVQKMPSIYLNSGLIRGIPIVGPQSWQTTTRPQSGSVPACKFPKSWPSLLLESGSSTHSC